MVVARRLAGVEGVFLVLARRQAVLVLSARPEAQVSKTAGLQNYEFLNMPNFGANNV